MEEAPDDTSDGDALPNTTVWAGEDVTLNREEAPSHSHKSGPKTLDIRPRGKKGRRFRGLSLKKTVAVVSPTKNAADADEAKGSANGDYVSG